jgi:phenylalanyl-tRNA synthetase alpha chain
MSSEIENLANTLHPLERKVLPLLNKTNTLSGLVEKTGLQEIEVMRALQWLENKQVLKQTVDLKEIVVLLDNGKKYLKEGLPERRFLQAIRESPKTVDELQKEAKLSKEEIFASIGLLKQKAAMVYGERITITENGKKLLSHDSLEEKFLKKLENFEVEVKNLSAEEKFAYENLKKRKDFLKTQLLKLRSIELSELGKKLCSMKIDNNVADALTVEMLKTGSWKNKKFRGYDVEINVPKVNFGRRHFVNEAIEYIRKIWIDLGFKEMEGTFVQSAFWDLDALFVPQDHPARTMQDTFYVKNPKFAKLPKLAEDIKKVHENGGNTGSKGWQYKWNSEEAMQNLLRTHTTVLSARTIHSLKKEDLPQKFFSVNKVFRNEALDWKHLFEFYQVEGIVIDPNANLKNLKGYLLEFFGKMGFSDVKLIPAHFPYTEPSMEVHVFNPVKKEWVELGGSGIFRPEVVKPLLGIDCPVLAWGLGMERIITDYYKITDLREIYDNDIKRLREIKKWMK